MAKTFFPDTVFAWVFCVTLFGLTCVAAWVDTRKAIVPNRLTVLIFVLGLVANAVRGGWLAAEHRPVWLFEPEAVWLGVLCGLLFALVSFLIVFAVMFGLWIFGLCGGGDVKLMAAVATWTGTWYFLLIAAVTLVVLVVWTIGQVVVGGGMKPRQVKKRLEALGKPQDKQQDKQQDRAVGQSSAGRRGKVRTTFSFPVAVATGLVLLWAFRVELQLVKPPPEQQQGASAHVRPAPIHA